MEQLFVVMWEMDTDLKVLVFGYALLSMLFSVVLYGLVRWALAWIRYGAWLLRSRRRMKWQIDYEGNVGWESFSNIELIQTRKE